MSPKYRFTVTAASFLLTAALVSLSFAQMRDITTMALVKDMGLGINLGNTFEAACAWDAENCWMTNTVNGYETAWGSPTVTKAMIQGYKNSGFKTVRVPVAWSNMMTGNALRNGQTNGTYTIDAGLMARVKEVVDWILAEDMYVILNIHWDGGWWKKFPTDSTECMQKYQRIWTQVGEQFKDYNDRLLFASLNEEGGWDDIWYIWRNESDVVAKARSYGILNTINQAFVNVIRAQGGNNANRHLQVQGYQTNIDRTVDQMFKMPTDSKSRLAVSVHYYDPFGFTHLSQDESWAQMRLTWGTAAELDTLNKEMDKLKTAFVDKGIPVIIGEYGVAVHTPPRGTVQVRNYTLEVTKAIYSRNMLPVLWDVQLNAGNNEILYYYDRTANPPAFVDPQMVAGFKEIAPSGPSTSILKNTVGAVQTRPSITVTGKTLNVSTSSTSDLQIRMIDVKGKIRANFKAANGSGKFPISNIPAGRYLIDIRGTGINKTTAVILK